MKTHILLGGLAPLLQCSLAAPANGSYGSEADVIQTDVAIIGGGSSGTHAAVRLKDLGQNVIVIEKAEELGGHVKTFTAASGVRVNYGVSNFQNYSVVYDFFSRFDISLVPYVQPGSYDIYADFTTAENASHGDTDFTAYLEQVDKYPWIGSSWSLPDPVPEDLLMPFGDFVEKYSLQDVAFTIAQFAIGNGNVFDQPTIYILKAVDGDYVRGLTQGTGIAPESYDTASLFERALAELGSDVLLCSTVHSATRSDSGVKLVVDTPEGQKTIKAKKLLVTAPPEVGNLEPLGLDDKEEQIFSQFEHKAFYTGLLNNTGLETGTRYYNADPDAVDTYNVPEGPALGFIWATRDPDTYWAWYTSPTDVSEDKVKSDTIEDFKNLAPGSDPQWIAYASATPSTVGVTADRIKNRFYDDLLSLQGYRNTWYTGSAWVSDHSAALWNHTEYALIPDLLA